MGGTGSKQEDQIITVMIEKAAGKKITYVPFKGGGDVAVQLVGKHIDSSVNNPIEAESHWRAGKLRPLCVMDEAPACPTRTRSRPRSPGPTSRPARRPACRPTT
jgi:putative tricarboxylic transport membrane protein